MKLIAIAAAALLTSACATSPQISDPPLLVRGQVVHLDRVAMPESARALVELRVFSANGIEVLATLDEPFAGRQVPIPFSSSVPARAADAAELVELRSGVVLDGRIIRASQAVPVFTRSGEDDVGDVVVQQFNTISFGTTFSCGDTEVMFDAIGDYPVMRVGVAQLSMQPSRAASGARFEAVGDPDTVFHTKGDAAVVSLRGVDLPPCVKTAAPKLPLRASGNEPPWTATVDDGRITLSTGYDSQTRAFQLLGAQQSGEITRYRATDGAAALVMTATRSICRDSMTGMPHPYAVDMARAGALLHGCGGDPLALLANNTWEVTLLDDTAPVSGSRITLRFFAEDGFVAGVGSCNRYNAGFALSGENLKFKRAATTLMACPEPQMAQERRFHAVLNGVHAFDIDGAGMLVLSGSEGRLVARALPVEP